MPLTDWKMYIGFSPGWNDTSFGLTCGPEVSLECCDKRLTILLLGCGFIIGMRRAYGPCPTLVEKFEEQLEKTLKTHKRRLKDEVQEQTYH